jgi:hypothetical protein
LFTSLCSFTQAPLHCVKPELQDPTPQWLDAQLAVPFAMVGQRFPHEPQLFTSAEIGTSQPSTSGVPVQLAHPESQMSTQPLCWQVRVATFVWLQTAPQAPQLFTSFERLSQASPHWVNPVAHPPVLHEPLTQEVTWPATAQPFPQAPQLLSSVSVSTQAPPHAVYP